MRVHHPLQQGLRPSIFCLDKTLQTRASTSSITTRIKTNRFSITYIRDYASASTSSITTRIKTASGTCYTSVTLRVRVHHPLQQGLRLTFGFIILIISYVRVHHPLQQGLRPHLCVY